LSSLASRCTTDESDWHGLLMKIFVTSDLLWRSSTKGDRAVVEMSRWLKLQVQENDLLLLLGNAAETTDDFRDVLSLFHALPCAKSAILGNREAWSRTEASSWDKRNAMVHILRGMGFSHLEDQPMQFGSLGVCGAMGWYDYSLRDDIEVPLSAYQNKIFPGHALPSWNDALYAKWGQTDETVTQNQIDLLRQHLDSLSACKYVIACLHHLPHKDLLLGPRFLMPKLVRYANAFQGSQRFHDLFSHYPNIRWAFCGHIQNGKRITASHIRYASVGSTAEKKELLILEGDKLTVRFFAP